MGAAKHETYDVVIVEPQCRDFEHAQVNAAYLVGTAQKLGGNRRILFLCESLHWAYITAELGQYRDRIEWRPIPVPARRSRGYVRLIEEVLCVRGIARRIGVLPSDRRMLFLSGTPQTLIALRLVGRSFSNVQMILHSILETLIAIRQTRALWEIPLSLRNVLRFLHPKHVQFVLLGERLMRTVQLRAPGLISNMIWTDLPCWSSSIENEFGTFHETGIRIGAIGVGHKAKGTDLLVKLAKLLNRGTKVKLVLIGYVKDRRIQLDRSGIEVLSHGGALGSEEMRKAIANLDYALFLFRPGSYLLTESASFCDAVSAGKPIIALRSEMIEEKFRRFGNIGYMGDSIKEISEIILRIAAESPLTEYQEQRRNIHNAADMLSPSEVAGRLFADNKDGLRKEGDGTLGYAR